MAPRNNNPDAGRGPVNQSVAESIVADSLGLDASELSQDDGLGDGTDDGNELDQDDGQSDFGQDDLGDDGDGDDIDSDPNDPFDPSNIRQQRDPNDRVSHTKRGQEQEPKRPLPRRSEVKADRKGNLIGKDGKVVARAGREARLYQSRERARRDLSRAQTEATNVRTQMRQLAQVARGLHTQVQANKAADEKLKQLGLTANDQLAAMNLFVEIRDNPGTAIKRIMARAAANGVDLTQLGQGGNIGLDAKALADLVKQEVSKVVEPLTASDKERKTREEQENAQRQQNENAKQEVQAFFGRNPEAMEYAPVIMRVLENPNFANLSLGEIYARILQHPNLTRGNSRQRSRTPNGMPRGRGSVPQGNSKFAHPNTSYEAIISQALNEAGVR